MTERSLVRLVERAQHHVIATHRQPPTRWPTPVDQFLIEIYEPIRRYMYSRLQHYTDAAELAEDNTQEVLIRVVAGLGHCRATSDAGVGAWVMRVAQHVLVDCFRTPSGGLYLRSFAVPNEWTAQTITSNEAMGYRAEGTAAFERLAALACDCCHEIDGVTNDVLWWRLVAGADWMEVAQQCRLTPSAAKRRYQRAQRALRAEIERRIASFESASRVEVHAWLESRR